MNVELSLIIASVVTYKCNSRQEMPLAFLFQINLHHEHASNYLDSIQDISDEFDS